MHLSRREAIALIATAGAVVGSGRAGRAQASDPLVEGAVARNDAAARRLLDAQLTDSASRWRGSVPDQYGLHTAGSAAGVIETLTASFMHPRSRFHHDGVLIERIRLAAGFLERSQSPDGNIDLLITNFNSPPTPDSWCTGWRPPRPSAARTAWRRSPTH